MINAKHRVWIIGLDGATFELIKPWARDGELPTFARLLDNGAQGALRSPIPQSPPAWTSFMTGKNPGKHGIFEFVQPRRGSYEVELTNGAFRRAETLWHILSRYGRNVGVVNVPMTFPPEPVNGFLISGFDTPYGSTSFTYPPELCEAIRSRLGKYTFFPVITGVPLRQVIENFHETIDLREQVMKFLFESYDLDFFMMVFNATDSTQHLCLQSYDGTPENAEQMVGLLSVYKRLDRFLADLLDRLPANTSLVIMSDHGGGPLCSYVNLDHWISKQGWLRYAADSSETAARQQRARWLAKGVTLAKSFVPAMIKKQLRQVKGLKAAVDGVTTPPRLDWARTRAYTCTSQGVYINLRGRQPQGIVEPGDEYEALRAQIAAALMELKDPETHAPIVAQVHRKEDFFWGPCIDIAPDLYIHWQDDAYLSWSDDQQPRYQLFRKSHALGYDEVVPDQTKSVATGCHRQEGIFILYGEAARPGQIIEDAQLIDMAPTVLALMGEPVPKDMDGRVLTEALSGAHVNKYPVEYAGETTAQVPSSGGSIYSVEEEEAVEQRLRELGYL
jgi:predicted AlkP superfamily phosphohydrolase/phosphomutase